MSVFEDTGELWHNALEDWTVVTVKGPTSIETLQVARDRFEQMANDPSDGTLVISIEVAREIPEGWVEITGPAVPPGHEEFRPFDDKMVSVTENVDSREAFICRSDAVRLDMEIIEPTGVVAIDFDRGETDE